MCVRNHEPLDITWVKTVFYVQTFFFDYENVVHKNYNQATEEVGVVVTHSSCV